MELNNKLMYYRRTHNLKDTSQHENYMCFRNELHNNKPITLTTSFYDTLPNYGSLDFDFVQFSRPKPGNPKQVMYWYLTSSYSQTFCP